MTPKTRTITIIAGVVVVVLIVVGFFASKALLESNPTPYVPEPIVVVPGQMATTTWKTLEELELGISVNYPNEWRPLGTTAQGIGFDVDTSQATAAIGKNTLKKPTLGIGIVSGKCVPSGSTIQPFESGTSVINGVVFTHAFVAETSTLGSSKKSDIYSTEQNKSCYTIYLNYDVEVPSSAPEEVEQVKRNNLAIENYIRALFRDFVGSFKFETTPEGQSETEISSVRIDSIQPLEGPIGSIMTITGQNFSGHDALVWISKGAEKGVLWGGMPSSDKQISAIINASVCREYTGGSGLPCSGFMKLVPGTYTVMVQNSMGMSNEAYIKIK